MTGNAAGRGPSGEINPFSLAGEPFDGIVLRYHFGSSRGMIPGSRKRLPRRFSEAFALPAWLRAPGPPRSPHVTVAAREHAEAHDQHADAAQRPERRRP
ncbi:hypothetical protein GCM10009786_08690 [Leucobacter alluvii]|uniref:Uncharacterized protein n=1 Tax=Leucobacter alluvii TaxID=340321 RepID=A0ABP5MYM5_9MICO